MIQKRYEFWSKEGKTWSEWFDWDGPQEPYQLDKRLKNQYREV